MSRAERKGLRKVNLEMYNFWKTEWKWWKILSEPIPCILSNEYFARYFVKYKDNFWRGEFSRIQLNSVEFQ